MTSGTGLLRQGDVPVLRITNEEVKAREGPGLDKVREFFKDSKPSLFSGSNPGERQLISSKLAHQIQVGVVQSAFTWTFTCK